MTSEFSWLDNSLVKFSSVKSKTSSSAPRTPRKRKASKASDRKLTCIVPGSRVSLPKIRLRQNRLEKQYYTLCGENAEDVALSLKMTSSVVLSFAYWSNKPMRWMRTYRVSAEQLSIVSTLSITYIGRHMWQEPGLHNKFERSP